MNCGRNLRLVVYIAKKFDSCQTATEDLVSIGTIGLMKAVRTFDPNKNIKLATYASRCIENEILMHLRKVSNMKTEMSFDEPLSVDWDGNELTLSDVLGTAPREPITSIWSIRPTTPMRCRSCWRTTMKSGCCGGSFGACRRKSGS